ncbi:hypothetical protein I4U23_026039 [Adineta vaga]|nr:hypothetical protein I4U23_026039 [Adineta vaga]
MALTDRVQIIWLGVYVPEDAGCYAFERISNSASNVTYARTFISIIEENVGRILFVHNYQRALELIRTHCDKQIIFIASDCLDQDTISSIQVDYPNIYRFYIFSHNITCHNQISSNERCHLKIFDKETDLLVQALCDMSNDIIKQVEMCLETNDLKQGFHFLKYSLILTMKLTEFNTKMYLTMLN